MRVLYFSDNTSVHNRRFLEKLSRAGPEVWFLDISHGDLPQSWLPLHVRLAQHSGVFQRESAPHKFEEFLPEFRSLLRDLRPEIVHAGPVQSCGFVAALSGFHPLLVMSWGSDLLLRAPQNAEWRRATEIALGGADGFFCDCETVRQAAEGFANITQDRIVQFPWGIVPGSFSPVGPQESLPFARGTMNLICTRSWEPLYDVNILLEAFLRARRESGFLRLILLGDGSEAKRIRNFIIEHELSEVVLTPGFVSEERSANWFRAAGAYVSCARSDGTSVSLLEAMAIGLPVVVTDNPSNREWVTEGKNGWLAPAGSAEDFAEKLLLAASLNPAERAAISERNRRIVAERADLNRNFPSLLRLYDELARQPATRVTRA